MKNFLVLSLFVFFNLTFCTIFAQSGRIDSLKTTLSITKSDTIRLKTLNALVEEISDENVWPKYNEELGALSFKLKKSNDPNVRRLANKNYATYLNNLGYLWVNKGNNTIALSYFIESLEADKINGNIYGQAYSENNIGILYMNEGKIDSALVYYFRSLKKFKAIKNKKGEALSLNNLGFIYNRQGNVSKALEYFYRSLKLREEIGDKQEQSFNHINIGGIYLDQKDYEKAIESFNKAYQIFEDIKSTQGQANALNNLGSCYKETENYTKAMQIFKKASKLFVEVGDKRGLATSLGNIGICAYNLSDYDTAYHYLTRSLKLYTDLKDKEGLAHTNNNLAMVYLKTGKIKESKEAAQQSFKLSKELNFPEQISQAAHTLSDVYKREGDCNNSYKMFELYIGMRDTTKNSSNDKAIIKQQEKYEYERKAAIAAIQQEKVKAVAASESKRQKIILVFTICGLLIVVVFSIFLYRRFKITQKQKKIIEQQKHLVDEKNEELNQQNEEIAAQRDEIEHQKEMIELHQKEMIDSINYAKRIQDAILPPANLIKEKLPDSFVLYRPKDIVAGDFYWMEEINNTILIAAADCTGHGVPGAMVSVVCSNALNRAVNEFQLTDSGKILDKVRDLVIETFEKSGEEIKDGMDISLLSIEFPSHLLGDKRGVESEIIIKWSGANNPLWYFNNNGLNEIKADKQPIGKSDYQKPFTTHSISLPYEEGERGATTFYLFTDGYADQFGGPKGKKFLYKKFKDLFLINTMLPFSEQQSILEITFDNWKGNNEQVDDVCVIGIKI